MEALSQCSRCPRLVAHRHALRTRYPAYHNAPVPAWGAPRPALLIIGLAPGLHGANASGHPFVGDDAGALLLDTLTAAGFCRPVSRLPGWQLIDCRITNAVKCLPPANRPLAAEVRACNGWLRAELDALPQRTLLLALGGLAHRAVLCALGLRQAAHPFGHDRLHVLPSGRRLLDSYHCSRYNVRTGRLTPAMLAAVVERARSLLAAP